MKPLALAAAFLASALAVGAPAAPRRTGEIVVAGDGLVAATINGVPGRIRVDPAAPAMPILATLYAERVQLRPGPFAFIFLVGPERVRGVSAVARIGIAGAPVRRARVGWTERPWAEGLDGVVGPGGVDAARVRFVLRAARAGERIVTLPLADEGGLFGGWGGTYALIQVGGRPMRVRFNPRAAETLATAGAAVRIAADYDGRMRGETRMAPISFGISRPVRTLDLARPLAIGPLLLSSLGVRTHDFGNAGAIREADADPDEILVTAGRRGNAARDRISIGADQLDRCSSILFDRAARRVELSCL